MTIASPSRFVVADIKWLVREFQRFPPMEHKNFWEKNYMQLGSQRCCGAVILSGTKHLCVVRLSVHQNRSEILRFAQDDMR
jgi:hypothetical protein